MLYALGYDFSVDYGATDVATSSWKADPIDSTSSIIILINMEISSDIYLDKIEICSFSNDSISIMVKILIRKTRIFDLTEICLFKVNFI